MKIQAFLTFKPLGNLFDQNSQFWFVLRYQYLFDYNNFLNVTYPYHLVFVRDIYGYPFYMGFYQYICI